MKKFISPINDFFFRYLLGQEKHASLTLDFINSVLCNAGMGPLQNVEIKNPFNLKDSITDKEIILDVCAQDEHSRIYDIEMQLSGNPRFVNRALYYWASCYTGQLTAGEDYRLLNPVICIDVHDFAIFDQPHVHNCFVLREREDRQPVLTDHLMLHFLDLTVFRKRAYTENDSLPAWLRYFCMDEKMKDLEAIMERHPAIREAHLLYEAFTANDELMQRYVARQKYLRDVSTIKADSYDDGHAAGLAKGLVEGEAKGREEGILEGEARTREEGRRKQLQIAASLKARGMDLAEISDITGLSFEDIERL